MLMQMSWNVISRMPEPSVIVINTGPLIALVAATKSLDILRQLYSRVVVPFEVCSEIIEGGVNGFAVNEFHSATWLDKGDTPVQISCFLRNAIDTGEASVIQTALDTGIPVVCIDESAGRRLANMHGLLITGSIGILLRAKHAGLPIKMHEALSGMDRHGIWLSDAVRLKALQLAGELS